jgi:hypothetical protein
MQVATGDVGDQVGAAYTRSRMEPEEPSGNTPFVRAM